VRRAAEQAGRRVVVAAVDVSKVAEVDAFVGKAVRELGSLHIVVANAGIARKVKLEDLDDDAWNKVLDVNLNGVWRCFRAALPHLRRALLGAITNYPWYRRQRTKSLSRWHSEQWHGDRLPKFKSWLLEFRCSYSRQGVTIYLASSPTIRGTDNATTSCWHNTYHLT
jgi:NAD(P)-dependent dehydrogenase (short-subunit alcohol dehydrogenase family)